MYLANEKGADTSTLSFLDSGIICRRSLRNGKLMSQPGISIRAVRRCYNSWGYDFDRTRRELEQRRA
jgi:hypothetical protein